MVPTMSPEFRQALRTELVQRVESTTQSAPRHPWRWLAGGTLALLLAGGATLATAELFTQPGMPVTTTVGNEITTTGTGSRTIPLGPAPDAATAVWFNLSCISPGRYELGAGGAAMTCTDEDAGTHQGIGWGPLPLSVLNGDSFTLTTSEDAQWKLTLAYVDEEPTDWAENSAGQTYGVQNDAGTPDLIAVVATNGREGYVHRDELEEADGTAAAREFTSPEQALQWQEERAGKTFSVPVYEADGTTLIGEFVLKG
jgi:hypothetical protein